MAFGERYYERYNTWERVCHWLVAGCFLILVITGIGLYDKAFLRYFDVLGGGSKALLIHKITGVVFFFASLTLSLQHWRDTLDFSSDDIRWIKCLGGYLSKGHASPPMGKFNTGQKLFGMYMLLGTIGLGMTGLVIWYPFAFPRMVVQWSLLFHSLYFVFMTVFVVIHVYLGTVGNPGTIDGILYGEVSGVWAKRHAPKWLAKIEARRVARERTA